MKLMKSLIIVGAARAAQKHECEACADTSCAADQLELGFSEVARDHCPSCIVYECEDCEKCPGKRSVECGELEKVVANGTFRTNCDKKCKNWECTACDACEDEVEECAEGFHSVWSDHKHCECDQLADVYGCECTPCESSGPLKEECGEDQFFSKEAVNDECGNKCFNRSCNDCDACPSDAKPTCAAGTEWILESTVVTDDCKKDCTVYSCESCDNYCPMVTECAMGEISQARDCAGDECDECNCPVLECRPCVACEDDKPQCEEYEMHYLLNDTFGECGDQCGIYGCVCADPCMDEIEPVCGDDARMKTFRYEDDCGNTCKKYQCVSYNPVDHLDDFNNQVINVLSSLFGDNNPGWLNRMVSTYAGIAKKAESDFDKKNPVCKFYGFFEEEDEAEEDSADEARGIPDACKSDAKQVRKLARLLRQWSEEYNKPCGDREGDEPVYHNKLVGKINKWRQKVIKKLCQEQEDDSE